jgi:adenosine deaminase
MGFDHEALREVTRTALRAAFVEEDVRRRLLDLV